MHSCSELCRNRTSKDVVEALQDLPGFVTAAWTAASSDKELSRTFYASFSSTRKARSGAVALSEDQDLLSNKGLTCNNGLTLIWQVSLLFLAQPRCNLDCHWKGIGTNDSFENPFYDSNSNINIWKRKSSTLSFSQFRPEGLWRFDRTADWKIPTLLESSAGGYPFDPSFATEDCEDFGPGPIFLLGAECLGVAARDVNARAPSKGCGAVWAGGRGRKLGRDTWKMQKSLWLSLVKLPYNEFKIEIRKSNLVFWKWCFHVCNLCWELLATDWSCCTPTGTNHSHKIDVNQKKRDDPCSSTGDPQDGCAFGDFGWHHHGFAWSCHGDWDRDEAGPPNFVPQTGAPFLLLCWEMVQGLYQRLFQKQICFGFHDMRTDMCPRVWMTHDSGLQDMLFSCSFSFSTAR